MAAQPRMFPVPLSAAQVQLWLAADGYWTLSIREGAGLASATAAEPEVYARITYGELVDVLAAVIDGWVPARRPGQTR